MFSVSALVVSNKNVIDDQNFKALSMSAEKWLDIHEVKVSVYIDCYTVSPFLGK